MYQAGGHYISKFISVFSRINIKIDMGKSTVTTSEKRLRLARQVYSEDWHQYYTEHEPGVRWGNVMKMTLY